ncbi:MAG: GPGG-motif small membrane protein [Aeromicrobium sp.]
MATVTDQNKGRVMAFILWIIAVAIAIYGVLRLVRGDILVGIILLVVAALVGPGGYSIFK